MPKAITEGPLNVGAITFDCAVLDDAERTRAVSEQKFMAAREALEGRAL